MPVYQNPGPLLWRQLHLWALTTRKKDADALKWLDEWEKNVERDLGACGCYDHWRRLRERYPFDWREPFVWSVYMHNRVNVRLAKVRISIEYARRIWTP